LANFRALLARKWKWRRRWKRGPAYLDPRRPFTAALAAPREPAGRYNLRKARSRPAGIPGAWRDYRK